MAEALYETATRLLGALADGLPVVLRPFADLGVRCGMSEDDVLAALRELRSRRVLRRLGARFDPARLGYAAELGALAVPEERVEDVAAMLAALPNITHVFEFEDRYRLWYTLVGPSRIRLEIAQSELARSAGAADRYRVLPDELHKITTAFDADGAPEAMEHLTISEAAGHLDRDDKALVRLLQGDLPLTARPFSEIAHTLATCGYDVDERWVLDRTRSLIEIGVVTRIAATVRMRDEPWRSALAIWSCVGDPEAVAELILTFPEVLHCFDRRVPGGMAVFSVIEGPTRSDIDRSVERIRVAGELDAPRIAFPLREYARSSMRYFTDGD